MNIASKVDISGMPAAVSPRLEKSEASNTGVSLTVFWSKFAVHMSPSLVTFRVVLLLAAT